MEDPGRFLETSLKRIRIFFYFLPFAESHPLSNLARVLSFGLFLPFMVYGLILSRKCWRKCVPLYLFAITYSLVHIASWPGPRYRLPVDAVLVPFAGLAIADIVRRLAKRLNVRAHFTDGTVLP